MIVRACNNLEYALLNIYSAYLINKTVLKLEPRTFNNNYEFGTIDIAYSRRDITKELFILKSY